MILKLKTYILNTVIFRFLKKQLKNTYLPGFRGANLYESSLYFYHSVFKESLTVRAASLAFNFFLALFPAIIFLFTLIAYIPIEGLQDSTLAYLEGALPNSIYLTIKETIIDILSKQSGGLLSIGILLALFFSSNGFSSLIRSFDSTNFNNNLGFFQLRTRSLILSLVAALFVILISVLLILVGILQNSTLSDQLMSNYSEKIMVSIIQFFLLFAFIYCSYSIYYFVGTYKKMKWHFFAPGTILASFLSLVSTYGFRLYVDNFNSYNKLYGSIGTIMALMLLVYINSLSILVGFELNLSIDKTKGRRNKKTIQ